MRLFYRSIKAFNKAELGYSIGLYVYPINSVFFFFCFFLPWSVGNHGSSYSYGSKFLVSHEPFTSGMYGDFRSLSLNFNYLSFDQLIPAKNGWALIYSTPLTPSLSFASEISFLIKSAAWGLTSASFGITRYFLQFWILCHVYLGYSDAKGGYPTNIS